MLVDRSDWYFKKFRSFKEAEEWEDEYYRNLTPEQRMKIFFALKAKWAKDLPKE